MIFLNSCSQHLIYILSSFIYLMDDRICHRSIIWYKDHDKDSSFCITIISPYALTVIVHSFLPFTTTSPYTYSWYGVGWMRRWVRESTLRLTWPVDRFIWLLVYRFHFWLVWCCLSGRRSRLRWGWWFTPFVFMIDYDEFIIMHLSWNKDRKWVEIQCQRCLRLLKKDCNYKTFSIIYCCTILNAWLYFGWNRFRLRLVLIKCREINLYRRVL